MNQKDIKVLLKKAEELKALFVLGHRVIPFLEEIFVFISEIQPLLDEINHSIEDNLKKMPNASKQLSKVTEANEMATTEIMDIVDGLVYKTDLIAGNLDQLEGKSFGQACNPLQVLELIYKSLQKDTDPKEIMPQISDCIHNMRAESESDSTKLVKHSQELLESIKMDSSSIMMSLQVQDITSQQIAAVNHLLETIQSKLTTILSRFSKSGVSEIIENQGYQDSTVNVSELHRKIAFDPDAVDSYSEKEFRQENVDRLMAEQQSKEAAEGAAEGAASQDDIDKMFESNKEENDSDNDENESASQDDIDKMFESNKEENDSGEDQNGDDMEQVSQDDIDALFGK